MANEGYYLEIELDSNKEKNYFYSSFSDIKKGDHVVVESEFGLEVGLVCENPVLESECQAYSCKPILRVANDEDLKFYYLNKNYERDDIESISLQYAYHNNSASKIVNEAYYNMRKDVENITLLPYEIRDKFIEDVKNGRF